MFRQSGADWLEIIAGIKPLGNGHALAQRLAIAQIGRTGQDIDLSAGVVDVIFASHPRACELHQPGKRVAENRAASVADMHGAGGIGGNIFDIHLFRRNPAGGAAPEIAAKRQDFLQNPGENLRLEADIQKTGPRDLGPVHLRRLRQGKGQLRGELARIAERGFGLAGEDHGGVAGEVAEARIPWRLDDEAPEIEILRQSPLPAEIVEKGGDSGVEFGVNIHTSFPEICGRAGLAQFVDAVKISRPTPRNPRPSLCIFSVGSLYF